MKKIAAFILMISILISCQKAPVEKPDNLIDEDVMVDIIYDLAILEAIKSQNLNSQEIADEYVYKKYKIDSLQFAKNDQYYASDIKKYEKIYKRVAKRMEEKMSSSGKGKDSGRDPDQPLVK